MLSHYLEILMEYLHESIIKAHPLLSSYLDGVQKPFNLNWAEGNGSSSLVSQISNMSILESVMKDNVSNLSLIELIIKWSTIIFSGHMIFEFTKSNFCIKNIVVFSTIK